MALDRIKDLEQVFKSADGRIVEWRSPQYEWYRYDRDLGAVGPELPGENGLRCWEWHVLDKNDLSSAKRKVFELINENEL
ncbi:hypothetical protein QWY74_12990 [Halomonas almeriensis]|uniref:hypothetical protein n=1 Tax=Halomonas almeriensis TaxID=308163 RepID=UPI0025B35B39|nr:hypothetical protein [Halomonas almeriensis]MDN3554358.1 hypothetical protein [Halomonas almeriensis]